MRYVPRSRSRNHWRRRARSRKCNRCRHERDAQRSPISVVRLEANPVNAEATDQKRAERVRAFDAEAVYVQPAGTGISE